MEMNDSPIEGILTYPSDLSCFSPKRIEGEVIREAMLSTMDYQFSENKNIVLINGSEGMGKTTLLSQFQQKHISDCISIFIEVVNKHSYCEENIILDLYRQVSFYLNGVDPSNIENITQKELNTKFYLLQNALVKSKKKIFIIIDGLDDIPKEDELILQSIIDIFPFQGDRFQYAFSTSDKSVENKLKKLDTKKIEMMLYTHQDLEKLLPDISSDDIKNILDIIKGVPDKVNIIKNLIADGLTVNEILQDNSTGTDDLYKFGWDYTSDIINKYRVFFGLIAYSIRPMKVLHLSSILNMDEKSIVEIVESVSFLEEYEGTIRFLTNGIRAYAKANLSDLESTSLNKIVSYLSNNPEDRDSLSEINSYHSLLGNYSAIIAQLTNQNIKLLFNETNSVNEIVKQLNHGRNAASKLSSESELLRLVHAHSIISGMTTSNLLESELICHLTHEDYESAMGLVTSIKIIEDRLHLLSVVATYQKENKGFIDSEIEIKINEDFSHINPEHLGIERTIDLATNLFKAYPDLALSLINKVDSLEKGGSNKADYAFFKFSMETIKKDNESIDSLVEVMDSTHEKKKHTLNMLGMFKRGTPAQKILTNISNFTETSDAIFILKNWIHAFPDDKGAFLLVEKLLSLIISSTDFHANASLYADISTSLQYMKKSDGLQTLNRIMPLLNNLKKAGPTVDFVRLKSNIILFEKKYNISSDEEKNLSKFVLDEIDDQSIKLAALCLMSSMNVAPNLKYVEIKSEVFENLISKNADHIQILKDAILKEVEVSLDEAIRWTSKLNIQPRRDYLLHAVLAKACSIHKVDSIDRFCREIRKIKNNKYRFKSILALFDYCSSLTSISKSDIKKLIKLKNRIRHSINECDVDTRLLLLIKKVNHDTSQQVDAIVKSLRESWNRIDGDWYKIDVAFKIHNQLIEQYPEIANIYKDNAIDLRINNPSYNRDIVDSQVFAVDLAIRSYYFLCKQNADSGQDLINIINLISSLPATIPKIKEFARLASVLDITNNQSDFINILDNHLLPNLESLGPTHSHEFGSGFYFSAPIILSYSRDIFERKLSIIESNIELYDKILQASHNYMLNKTILFDPFRPVKNFKYKLLAKDLESHLYLINKMKEDSRIYFNISSIVKIISQNPNDYNQTQKSLVESFINDLIATKLDHPDYIYHMGYKLTCKALILNISKCKNSSEWHELLELARNIPVDSDKAFVFGEIIRLMPSSLTDDKKLYLREAVTIIDNITANIEKLLRYERLAEIGQTFDKPFVKELIKNAVVLSMTEDTDSYETRRLDLIDSINSMDKDFASGLSALVDSDPARKKIIDDNVRRKMIEKQEKDEFNVTNSDIKTNTLSPKYPNIAWDLLGKLNASNHIPSKKDDYLIYIDNLASYDFHRAYPMFSYYIHSIGTICIDKKMTIKRIRPMFDSLINSAYLFNTLCFSNNLPSSHLPKNDEKFVFDSSQSAEAIQFIKKWVNELSDTNLTIIDPYFTVQDLLLISNVINKDPNFSIRILTSYSNIRNIQNHTNSDEDVGDILRDFWLDNVSNDSVPDIVVIFCGVTGLRNEMPIHDRWWLADKVGLELGCSMNGVEGQRITSISRMKHDDVLQVENKVNGYLNHTQRLHKGDRIKYQVTIV